MYLREANARKIKLALWMVPLILMAGGLLAFWRAVGRVLWLFLSTLLILVGFEITPDTSMETIRALQLTGFNCLLGFGLVFFIWLGRIAAQALLPVENLREGYRAGWHLLLYILRLHGPAVFIKDGKQLASAQELKRLGPGVVVVDFNSAVVLEELIPPPSALRPIKNLLMNILIAFDLSDMRQSPRARGAGIVFTRRRERIRAVVDLRNQWRMRPRISAYTRDGIEVAANVWAAFTIGQEPDVLEVVYDGAQQPDQLRVVTVERVGGSRVRLNGWTDELDELDQREIHRYARVAARLGELSLFTPQNRPNSQVPRFDRSRVFSAAISQARNNENELIPWTDLPTQFAVDVFRSLISQSNFDEYFGLGAAGFPLPGFKSKLRMNVRNNGLLAYRVIRHRANIALRPGVEYEMTDLLVTNIRQLANSKVLRDRGIKVMGAGFGELIPVSDLVPQQRLESWSASWMRDTEISRATGDLNASRIRTRERVLAQRDLFLALNEILQNDEYSEEVIALRVMQTLEQAASDPDTRKLLPPNTLDVMKTVNQVLANSGGDQV